jgi:hypothetical protein
MQQNLHLPDSQYTQVSLGLDVGQVNLDGRCLLFLLYRALGLRPPCILLLHEVRMNTL